MQKYKLIIQALVIITAMVIGGLITSGFSNNNPQPVFTNNIIIPKDGLIFSTSDGKTVAKMNLSPDGTMFFVYNNKQQPCAVLGSDTLGGALCIYDNNGKTAALTTVGDQGGNVFVYDAKENLAGGIETYDQGATMCVYNEDGKPLSSIGAGKNGGALFIYNDKQNIAAGIEGYDFGGSIILYDQNAKAIWGAPDQEGKTFH